ncbi:MAG: class I SAM-dependent methyltransferase [Spirochaetes bacterium]|nr:class I SAM-dependent methyltransferase [Spirochaetota bacterium]
MKLYHELAPYYFSIENNHRDIVRDVSFIVDLIRGKEHPTLLDLGCGTGEHVSLLSQHGIECTGIDISEEMLATARARFPEGIEFILSDMADIGYEDAFDVVISLFGSFNYLLHDADIHSTLLKIRNALRNDGVGLLEVWNSPPIVKIGEKEVGPVSETSVGDALIARERGFRLRNEAARTVVEVNYRYHITRPDGRKTIRDRHVMRSFTADEITRFLTGAGLTVKKIYANFLSEPYQENSNRMVVLFDRI